MTGITRDPVTLAVELAERLAESLLPTDTVARLQASEPLRADECWSIRRAFQETMDNPRLSTAQRDQFEELVAQITNDHPELARDANDDATAEDGVDDTEHARRRWPRIAAVVLLCAALVASSLLAWENYRTGQDWQVRARAAQADVDRLVAENDTLEADLEAVTASLDRSEADVRLLERRVSRAADLKARAEDEREMANAYAERITEIALAYDEVAQWFSACRQEQSNLTSMVFDFESYYYTNQTYLISNQIGAVTDACNTAESYLTEVRRYVQALGE